MSLGDFLLRNALTGELTVGLLNGANAVDVPRVKVGAWRFERGRATASVTYGPYDKSVRWDGYSLYQGEDVLETWKRDAANEFAPGLDWTVDVTVEAK